MIELLQHNYLEPIKDIPDKNTVRGHSLAGMSTTRERVKDDFYATPPESTVAILKEVALKGSIWEPACGQGHMSEVIKEFYPDSKVYSTDLVDRGYAEDIVNFLDYDGEKFDNIITNPPFKLTLEFIEHSLQQTVEDGFVIMLLRLNFFETKARKPFFERHMPKYAFVHHKRVSFTEDGKRDSVAYMHCVWQKGYYPDHTELRII